MPGMFAHCGHLFGLAREARDRTVKAVNESPQVLVWPGDAIVTIIMAAATTEAFINELTEMVALHRDAAHRRSFPISPQLCAFANALEEIEKDHGSLQLKYIVASQMLSGRSFDKGQKLYQDFACLVRLRNDIMHLKPQDNFDHEEGGKTTIRPPKHIQALQQRKLALKPPEGIAGMSWFNTLMTPAMADWACSTALNIILEVLAMIPDGPRPGADPTENFKQAFRRFANQP
jgi:hypothetical protein